MNPNITSQYVQVDDFNLHYLTAGKGEVILLLHGFPTSAYLWRHIIEVVAEKYQVIALDLPGYGKSDKRLEDSFSFRYYNRTISKFLDQLGIAQVRLGVHDVGGPIGLFWMVQNMDRVNRLILFNTLVYPKFSWAVKLFGLATLIPGLRDWLTSPNGIKKAIQIGVYHKEKITPTMIKEYQSPFVDKHARKVLLKSVQRLSLKGFATIEQKLPQFKGPVQIIYGENDKILPKVGRTMELVKKDLPQAKLVSLPNCGHFLQEDAPEEISRVILTFMAE